MKRVAAYICISISFMVCAIMIYPDSVLSDEKKTMTMTELYGNWEQASTDVEITIETKEELCLFRDYVKARRDTSGITFSLINDIYWSDYEFRYDKQSDRMGVYKNNVLEVVYGWELSKVNEYHGGEQFYVTKEYKDFVTEEENKGEKYQFDADFWITPDWTMDGNFEGNNHTIYGFLLKGSFLKTFNGNISNLMLSDVYSENAAGVLIQEADSADITNCRIEHGYVYKNEFNELDMGMIGTMNNGNIMDCQVDACFVYEGKEVHNCGGDAGMLIGDAHNVTKICNNSVKGTMKIRGLGDAGGIVGDISYEDCSDGYAEIRSCRSNVDIDATYKLGMRAGGIVGDLKLERGNVKIIDCQNEGSVRTELAAGGIVGHIYCYEGNMIICACINRGEIKNPDVVEGSGGIVGHARGNVWTLYIMNCTNQGSIFSLTSAGGLVGRFTNRYEEDPQPRMRLQNCCNQGEVHGGDRTGAAGGLCNVMYLTDESNESVMITNCYNSGTVENGNEEKGMIAGLLYHGSIWNCYYANGGSCQAVGIKQGTIIDDVYEVTQEQLFGTETAKRIGVSGYANVFTLKDALNNGVHGQDSGQYCEWIDGIRGPVMAGDIGDVPDIGSMPTLTPPPTPTETPTPPPTPTEMPTPTLTPTKSPITPTGRPTLTPTPIPTEKPTPEPPSAVKPDQTSIPVPVQKPQSSKKKKKAAAKKMRAPTFTVKKKRLSSGRRYVKIQLKKYAGKYVEIKVKKKKKYYILKLKNSKIKKNKKVFNFSYSSQRGTLTFKLRTYIKKGKKRIYSKESKKKRIRLS